MFLVKQLVGALLMPLPVAVLLAGVGGLAGILGRRHVGRSMVAAGGIVAIAATLAPVGNLLLAPLETRYAVALNIPMGPSAPQYIVVLGSGYNPRAGLPITAALDFVALARLVEGVRLYRELPGSRLVVSGGGPNGRPPSAHGYAEAAKALGVPAESILTVDDPLDTGAEIRAISDRVGDSPVLLVTSAAHMPRAMAHCARVGVQAIPAPTGHLGEPVVLAGVRTWLPSGVHLRKTETALHEYVGLFALRLGVN